MRLNRDGEGNIACLCLPLPRRAKPLSAHLCGIFTRCNPLHRRTLPILKYLPSLLPVIHCYSLRGAAARRWLPESHACLCAGRACYTPRAPTTHAPHLFYRCRSYAQRSTCLRTRGGVNTTLFAPSAHSRAGDDRAVTSLRCGGVAYRACFSYDAHSHCALRRTSA